MLLGERGGHSTTDRPSAVLPADIGNSNGGRTEQKIRLIFVQDGIVVPFRRENEKFSKAEPVR